MIYYANFSTSFLLPYDFFTPVLIYQESVDLGMSNHVIFTYNPFASNRSTLIYLVQRYSLPLMVVVISQQRQPSLSFFQPQRHLQTCQKTFWKTFPEVTYWATPAVCNKETKSSYKKPQSHKTPCTLVINVILGRFYEAI